MNQPFYKIFAYPNFEFKQINIATPFDWSATYFQLSIEHALRYATDKKPDNNIICLTSFKLINDKIPIHELKNDIFFSNISGLEKANYAKQLLGISEEKKLMKEINGILIIYDNPSDLEIIISHDKVNEENLSFENIAQFQIKDHVITHWKPYNQKEWIALSALEKMQPHLLTNKIITKCIKQAAF
jgi:hypothetical protein